MGLFPHALLLGALVLMSAGAPEIASAQTAFPAKSVTLVVPAAAGGPTDTVARLVAESMSRTLGQTVLVENIGGAGGTIGMARVAKAAPDGYTIAVWHIAQATAPALYEGLKYDAVNDFDHLGRITDVPMTLVSKTALPAKNITELLDWIRAERGKVTYGHAGVGSASHLCMLMLMKELGVQLEGVAYRGTGPAMNDLMGGQFDFMCDQTTGTTNPIKGGKVKGYAVTTKFKVSSVPDLPNSRQRRHSGIRGGGVARYVGAQGFAQGRFRQTRGRTAGRYQRPESDRTVRRPRYGACCFSSRNARCAEIASRCRGEAMGHSHQGSRR